VAKSKQRDLGARQAAKSHLVRQGSINGANEKREIASAESIGAVSGNTVPETAKSLPQTLLSYVAAPALPSATLPSAGRELLPRENMRNANVLVVSLHIIS
jgi:hypothetical protein